MGGATRTPHHLLRCDRISIHAPRGGSDQAVSFTNYSKGVFQSTLPVGGATDQRYHNLHRQQFQSTLPVGGATARLPCGVSAPVISIHAPRGGSDRLYHSQNVIKVYFNPRSPWGERRGSPSIISVRYYISIHAPRGGSDFK